MGFKTHLRSFSRRRVLKFLVAIPNAVFGFGLLRKSVLARGNPLAYSRATHASSPTYARSFFDLREFICVTELCETIIPTDAHSPGAKAAQVPQFLDAIIAASDKTTKELWRKGVAEVDKMAKRRYGRRFEACKEECQIALVQAIARNEDQPQTLLERFFVALKKGTVEGYYTSAIGIHQDLRYQGNTALLNFPGCRWKEEMTQYDWNSKS